MFLSEQGHKKFENNNVCQAKQIVNYNNLKREKQQNNKQKRLHLLMSVRLLVDFCDSSTAVAAIL